MVIRRIAVVLLLSAALPQGSVLAAEGDVIAAEASAPPVQRTSLAGAPDCRAGDECLVEGAVRLSQRRGIKAARVDTASGCFAVALSRSQRRSMHDKGTARVRGFAYAYYATPSVKYYRVRDRLSGTGKCASGTMLYATAVDRLDVRGE
ncbi:hypothetical protein [Flavisphingomonas formosensis]|uniref:hypothetical protein n=1 Tax=Flavisphingomonas formosensis TaxID=861534 RepID=UPI0012FAC0D4|nr:hypothetical protein [Sphingomonas formosensis]